MRGGRDKLHLIEVHYWGPLLGLIPGYPPVVLCWGLLQESTAGVWREVGRGVHGAESQDSAGSWWPH